MLQQQNDITICLGSQLAIQPFYGRPETLLTPCQVVYGHLDDPENEDIRRGISYLRLRPGMLAYCCCTHEALRLCMLLGM